MLLAGRSGVAAGRKAERKGRRAGKGGWVVVNYWRRRVGTGSWQDGIERKKSSATDCSGPSLCSLSSSSRPRAGHASACQTLIFVMACRRPPSPALLGRTRTIPEEAALPGTVAVEVRILIHSCLSYNMCLCCLSSMGWLSKIAHAQPQGICRLHYPCWLMTK